MWLLAAVMTERVVLEVCFMGLLTLSASGTEHGTHSSQDRYNSSWHKPLYHSQVPGPEPGPGPIEREQP